MSHPEMIRDDSCFKDSWFVLFWGISLGFNWGKRLLGVCFTKNSGCGVRLS